VTDVRIPADPAERERLMAEAGLSSAERHAIDEWCYEQQRERAQGIVPVDEAGRK
jgi:hypothetical protein